eukprot:7458663-Alexandrium_andersonii.AAC.1
MLLHCAQLRDVRCGCEGTLQQVARLPMTGIACIMSERAALVEFIPCCSAARCCMMCGITGMPAHVAYPCTLRVST